MAEEPTVTEGAPSPPSETGFDSGGWFEKAGFDPQATDPSDIAAARDFHSKYSQYDQVYTPDDYQKAVETKVKEYFSDPQTHNVLKAHFKQALEQESRMAQQQLQAGDSPDASAVRLQQMQQTFNQKVASMEQVLGELVKLEQGRQKTQETEGWHNQFQGRLKDTVQRHANGTLDRDKLERELRRRYASSELKDDSPAAMQKALKALVDERLAERAQWARELGLDLGRIEGKPLPPNMSIGDAVGDDDTFDALLSRVVNHGMPPDPIG